MQACATTLCTSVSWVGSAPVSQPALAPLSPFAAGEVAEVAARGRERAAARVAGGGRSLARARAAVSRASISAGQTRRPPGDGGTNWVLVIMRALGPALSAPGEPASGRPGFSQRLSSPRTSRQIPFATRSHHRRSRPVRSCPAGSRRKFGPSQGHSKRAE